jgi:transposase InsO family protein/transposase-like protein
MVLAVQAAGQQRLLRVERAVTAGEAAGELARLRDENRRLRSENQLLKARLGELPSRKRHTPMQRLRIMWHMAYYGIPRSRVAEHFLIARSTFYRWLHAAESGKLGERRSKADGPRKTPAELARLIWEVFEANPHFGRHRIANVLWLLGVFVAASTVRNVLVRIRPTVTPAAPAATPTPAVPRQVVACYPNRVWSVDRTVVLRWSLWPTWVLVAIDPFFHRIVACCALDDPNAGWVVDALEEAFGRHGPPKHIISDQGEVFASAAFAELLTGRGVKQRFGAVGKHGSIAVTERAIRTLKDEWLRRVPVVRGVDHLGQLLRDFETYYNEYRGHSRLDGAVPALIHRGEEWTRPVKSAKTVPAAIERRVFADARVTVYRLAA